jgi:hypothetical protein
MCPYCPIPSVPPAGPTTGLLSDDHIFPQFLGGKTTIRACKPCNDRFGHTFEGRICKDLAPFFTALRLCGIKPARPFVWRRALKHDDVEYDINQDLIATPSKPVIQRDESGNIQSVIASSIKTCNQFVQGMQTHRAGRVEITDHHHSLSSIPWNWRWEIGQDLRRLVLKMCAAMSEYFRPGSETFSRSALAYLAGDQRQRTPVRLVLRQYDQLAHIRSDLAHSIFVEADDKTGRSYGIVQLFGVMELYALLNNQFSRESFAAFASLDLLTRVENFQMLEALNLPEAPLFVSSQEYDQGTRAWQEKLMKLLDGLNGTSMNVKVQSSPTLSRQIPWESSTVNLNRASWVSGTNPVLTKECIAGRDPRSK